jgi:hypothetical protein
MWTTVLGVLAQISLESSTVLAPLLCCLVLSVALLGGGGAGGAGTGGCRAAFAAARDALWARSAEIPRAVVQLLRMMVGRGWGAEAATQGGGGLFTPEGLRGRSPRSAAGFIAVLCCWLSMLSSVASMLGVWGFTEGGAPLSSARAELEREINTTLESIPAFELTIWNGTAVRMPPPSFRAHLPPVVGRLLTEELPLLLYYSRAWIWSAWLWARGEVWWDSQVPEEGGLGAGGFFSGGREFGPHEYLVGEVVLVPAMHQPFRPQPPPPPSAPAPAPAPAAASSAPASPAPSAATSQTPDAAAEAEPPPPPQQQSMFDRYLEAAQEVRAHCCRCLGLCVDARAVCVGRRTHRHLISWVRAHGRMRGCASSCRRCGCWDPAAAAARAKKVKEQAQEEEEQEEEGQEEEARSCNCGTLGVLPWGGTGIGP